MFYRSDYMSAQDELAILHAPGGLEAAHLELVRDRIVLISGDGQVVNPKSVHLYKLGLFSFTLRGSAYYSAACRAGDFQPGARVRLVREPENEHDPNAIAVYADRARRVSGYVNKLNAKRLAPMLDGGADCVAISTRGAGPGVEGMTPVVLAGERRLLVSLARNLDLPIA